MKKIVRFNPMPNMVSFRNEFDRMIEDVLGLTSHVETANGRSLWSLALDVIENDDAILIQANMPGVSPDNVEITFADSQLTLKGEILAAEEKEGHTYHIRERRHGSFSRTIRLPRNVDGEAIAASFKNGVLTVTVPKSEALKPRRIVVNSAS